MNPRQDVIRRVAEQILAFPEDAILRVGIDGDAGSGKSTFGDELCAALRPSGRPVIRASIDSFHNPRETRYRLGKDSPEGFFQDSHDLGLLTAVLLQPLSPGGSRRFRRAVFDHETDSPVPVAEGYAHPGSILIFDGIFLHRPELAKYWAYSVFLRVTSATGLMRCAARGDGSPDPLAESNRRYVEGWKNYLTACRPEELATVLIDNEVFGYPRIEACRWRSPLP